MAASSPLQRLKDEATCSLCGEFYTDPVTTECGDNFCRSCITEHWRGAGSLARCPECGATRAPEPLTRNRKLQRIVEQVKLLVQQTLCEEHREPLCTEDPKPTCLVCSSSAEPKRDTPVSIENTAIEDKGATRDRYKTEKNQQTESGEVQEDRGSQNQGQGLSSLHSNKDNEYYVEAESGKVQEEGGSQNQGQGSSSLHSNKDNEYDVEADAGDPMREAGEDVHALPGPSEITPSPPCGINGSPSGRDGHDELTLILVGSTGAGKSATGNTILGSPVFDSRPSAVPVTKECQRGEGVGRGRTLLVVDTPDFLSLAAPEKELSPELERCSELSSPGPHAILLVLQAGRFTMEEREAVQSIQRLFGAEALQFTVIVFTRGEDLESKTIENFLRDSEKNLKELVRSCGRRVCALNNRATGAEREQQVGELMRVIDKMVAGNGGKYCRLGQGQVDRGKDQAPQGFLEFLRKHVFRRIYF